jgi:phosphoserine aminotransferase
MVDINKWNIDQEGSFFHFCSNETVNGFEFNENIFPWYLIPKDMPIIADMSSNIGTFKLDWNRYSMIYMGA